jgi:hypothetical protein
VAAFCHGERYYFAEALSSYFVLHAASYFPISRCNQGLLFIYAVAQMLAILDGARNHFVLTPNSLVGYFGLIPRVPLRIAVALGVALLCLSQYL